MFYVKTLAFNMEIPGQALDNTRKKSKSSVKVPAQASVPKHPCFLVWDLMSSFWGPDNPFALYHGQLVYAGMAVGYFLIFFSPREW